MTKFNLCEKETPAFDDVFLKWGKIFEIGKAKNVGIDVIFPNFDEGGSAKFGYTSDDPK